MNRKGLTITIAILVIAGLIGLVIFSNIRKQIPDNPPETLGNTSGNLNNQGLFCESDGVIYFANVNDNHYLYSMNPDGSDAKLLMDVPVSFINAGGDYLYFYYADQGEVKFMGITGNMRGIYRLDKKGKDGLTCLDRTVSGIVNLIGNTLYYQHYDNTNGMTLYYASTDGKDKGEALNKIVNPACVVYGNIYFPDQDNYFYLNEYRPGATITNMLIEEQMYNPTLVGEYIYYINVADNYCLYRYNINDGAITKVTNVRVDDFNVYGNTIFYQQNKNPALVRVNFDGSNPVILAEGNYCNINCTSTYTYFQPFNEDNVMYMTPTNNLGSVMEFIP